MLNVSKLISRTICNVAKMQSKILLAFDFDHTVMEGNTDVIVQELAGPDGIPEEIKSLYKTTGWTEYMGQIFAHLHSNGVQQPMIENCMNGIPFVEGMKEMLFGLNQDLFDVVIISDSNSFFINCILKHFGLSDRIQRVYTNPASFDDDGCLRIKYYHTQDWCSLSTINLCKGSILENHIEESAKNGVEYVTIGYVGDGSNDLCPSLKLRSQDHCFARTGFSLPKKIEKLPEGQMQANVVYWKDGHDLKKEFNKLSNSLLNSLKFKTQVSDGV